MYVCVCVCARVCVCVFIFSTFHTLELLNAIKKPSILLLL